MTIGLWKGNAIGAAVSAVALTVATVVYWKPDWERYEATVRPAYTAAPGQEITVDGQTWAVRHVSRSTTQLGSGAPVPEGTARVNVGIERSGTQDAEFGCFGYLTDGERSWKFVGGQPCRSAMSMRWDFLVPTSARLTAVEIRTPDQAIVFRFQL